MVAAALLRVLHKKCGSRRDESRAFTSRTRMNIMTFIIHSSLAYSQSQLILAEGGRREAFAENQEQRKQNVSSLTIADRRNI